MKIKVDNEEIFEISDVQKLVIKNDIKDEIFEEDMKRRLKWVLTHKYERCFERLKKEWEPILSTRYEYVPTNKDSFAQLVFQQPEYKNRSQREKEEK